MMTSLVLSRSGLILDQFTKLERPAFPWDESGLTLASSYVQPFPRNLQNTMPFWDMPLAALASCMSTKMAKTASSETSSNIHHLWKKTCPA